MPPICCATGNHKFYSVTRKRWLSAGDLREGEQLDGVAGLVTVAEKRTLPGTHRVYNLTVQGEHLYRVAQSGVLVHNNGCRKIALGMDMPGGGVKGLAEQTGASWWRKWKDDGITRRSVTRRFGRAFHQAAERADVIHFSLDGIDDVMDAVRRGKAGFTLGNFTNAELHYIVSNPHLLRKTLFYRNGRLIPSPF